MDIRTELQKWLATVDWDTELTLPFSNDVSQQQAEQALRRFWSRVDWETYGNASKRYGKRIERMCVIQGDGLAEGYHFHIIAKMPFDRFTDISAFCAFLRKQWLYENSNNYVVTIAPLRKEKTAFEIYLSRRVRRDNCDALILDSSHISAAS